MSIRVGKFKVTLIEFMIVVAILGVVAAVIIPLVTGGTCRRYREACEVAEDSAKRTAACTRYAALCGAR